jgi:hypothetical protein
MSTATPYMFANVPPNKPSLRAAYEAWLEATSPQPPSTPRAKPLALNDQENLGPGSRVGIVGGGMAGLYSRRTRSGSAAAYTRTGSRMSPISISRPARCGSRRRRNRRACSI